MPSRSAAEEGIYALEPFGGKHDLPQSWAQAASRLHYIAMNMLRVDAGNEAFGHVAAVFSPAFWRDAVAAGPMMRDHESEYIQNNHFNQNGTITYQIYLELQHIGSVNMNLV